MSISNTIKERIKRLTEGTVVTFDNFSDCENKQAVALTLSRLKKEGVLERLEKGKYFIPKKTKFGTLGPSESSVLKSLLRGREGYISGLAAYNQLGLTTQVPNEITIVGSKYSRKTKIGRFQIKYVKGSAPIEKKSIMLLQILDAIKDIKKIPDTTIDESLKILKSKILSLNNFEKRKIITLSQYYRPSVQAIIGEILEEDGLRDEVKKLKENINPLTKFKYNFSKEILPLQESWNLA